MKTLKLCTVAFLFIFIFMVEVLAQSVNPIANQLIQQGYSFERLQRFEEALDAFEKARNINPNLADAWLGTSRMLMRLKRYEELKTKWSVELPKAPFSIRTQMHAELGCALWYLGDVLGTRSQWEAAVSDQPNESTFQTLYYSVLQYGIYEELLRFFLEKRESNPSYQFLSRLIFDLYVYTMNPDGALKEVLFQIRQNPNSENEWSAQLARFSGDSLTTLSMITTVETELRKRGLSLKEKIALYRVLGSIKFHSAMFMEAVKDYILADSLANGKGERLYEIGDRLLAENQYEPAALALEYAKRKSGVEQAYQLLLLGKLAEQQGDITKAREYWSRAFYHHPNEVHSEEAALRLARSFLLKNPKETISILRKMNSLTHRTKLMETSALLIEALYRSGNYLEASKEIQFASKLTANDANLWRGTIIYQNFLLQVLHPEVTDSILLQSISSLNQIPFADPISTQALQERIFWNTLQETPNLIPAFRTWFRTIHQTPISDTLYIQVTQTILNLSQNASNEVQREILFRVANDAFTRFDSNPSLNFLLEKVFHTIEDKFLTDARAPSLFLERAKRNFQQNDYAQAIRDLEMLIKFSPNSPEGEIARKLLRKWSRDG
ncbi:MAG: tetratricopeptide repeat protein [bacterium]|nr:tetratricopeptide repeat protein [bacterium]